MCPFPLNKLIHIIFEIKNFTYNQEKANNLLSKSGIILIQCEACILRTPFSLTGMYALVTIPLSSGQVSPDTCRHPLLFLMVHPYLLSQPYDRSTYFVHVALRLLCSVFVGPAHAIALDQHAPLILPSNGPLSQPTYAFTFWWMAGQFLPWSIFNKSTVNILGKSV